MNIGLDIGYSAVKLVAGDRRATFPSVVGSPDRARFSLNGHRQDLVLVEPDHVLVGDGAVIQSRFLNRREDRGWIESDEYQHLFLAALTEATRATSVDVTLVTGLPVAFYTADRDRLSDRLLATHRAQRDKRRRQAFQISTCRVIPQPFGALLAEALDPRGRVADQDLATGAVGVVDVGGKTTNLLSVYRLSEVARETASVSAGAWNVVRAVRDHLATACPNLDLRDHQIVDAIQARQVTYYGEPVDLSPVVGGVLDHMAEQVIAQATQLWNGGAHLAAILVAGGGAHLLGPAIQAHFRHARVVGDPVFSNANGYWKLAQRLGQ